MSLTISHGPLSGHPPETVNYHLEGPAHRLLLDYFPRRVRALVAGETVVDSRRGRLLHETGMLPQLYVPREDVRSELLEPTDRHTHCPFKGDASYWSVRIGDQVRENAAWAYPEPFEPSTWLRRLIAFEWGAMDGWIDEDEPVEGHLRDPYHRVDVRPSSRHVRILAAGEVLADGTGAKVLSETGLANRYYIPPEDVHTEVLSRTDTRTVCPYKGVASYWSARVGGRTLEDVAWSYPEPFEDATRVRDHLSFSGPDVVVEVDGEREA